MASTILGINPSDVILCKPTIDHILIEESSKGGLLSQGEDEYQCLLNKPIWIRKGLMGSLSMWGVLQGGEDDLNGASIENKAYEAHSPGGVSCTLCLIVGDARDIGRGGWEWEKRNDGVGEVIPVLPFTPTQRPGSRARLIKTSKFWQLPLIETVDRSHEDLKYEWKQKKDTGYYAVFCS